MVAVHDTELAYWTELLADAPRDLALPCKPGSRPGSGREARIEVVVDPAIARALTSLAVRGDTIPRVVFTAALRALLARFCHASELCIATAIANNTIVLRGRIEADDRFADVLRRERQIALDAHAHAQVPFDDVAAALGIDRAALAQIVCVDRGSRADLAGCELLFEVGEAVAVTYAEDRFERGAILGLIARYERMLAAVAADPDRPLSRIELLHPEERLRLIDGPVRVPHADGPTLVAEIERHMRETPHAPALVTESAVVTYGELEARTTRLAALLRRHGVGPERTVAVIADRGIAQLVGVVAVMRAGGAYVPIKPDQPATRTGWMLDEARPAVILVGGEGRLPPSSAVVVRLDEHDAWPAAGALEPREVPRDALAYLIYTSGSTGRPKGVMVSRRALDAQLRWHHETFQLDARFRGLQLHSFTFDASVAEIFWPLLAGGAVVLPAPGDELDGEKLGELVERTGTTVAQFVPSMLMTILETVDSRRWRTVELVILGGEALGEELVGRCARAFPAAVLVNTYGPTETTVNATTARCSEATRVTIGLPVTGTTAYVLGRDLGLVPPDGVGELWLGGIMVARAYLAQPGLTADRFLPDPFAVRAGARMYRTGDLVRQGADGDLAYVGRLDQQVKVRGFRIELGEIETVLQRHASVGHAVVTVSERGDQLIAYVVLGHATETAELARFLAERLPSYMVPAAYVVLSELPRTPSGKLDRKALPAPGPGDFIRADYVAPSTDAERALARIWTGVLGVEPIGVHDDFLALGGHSLLAMRMLTEVRVQLGVASTVRDVFDHPTISTLAARLSTLATSPAPPLIPVRRDRDLPVSFAQQRLWFLDQLEPGSRAHNLLFAFRLRGALNVGALGRAFEWVVARHEALRTVFTVVDDVAYQRVTAPAPVPLPVVELGALPPDARDAAAVRCAKEAAGAPFDLASGPLLRACLLRLAPSDHVLIVTMHHIVSDGWSMSVFWRDLGACYASASLPALPVQYADYAAWLRTSSTGDELAYWTAQLADPPGDLALPHEPGSRRGSGPGARIEFSVEPGVARALKSLAVRCGATPFMVFAAALRALLARFCHAPELCIATAIANRASAALDDVVGLFVNTIILRGRIDAGDRFSDVLRRERRVALDAYAHAQVPFDHVVAALRIERDAGRTPLAQIMCIDQGDVTADGALPGLTSEPFDAGVSELAGYELLFELYERAGERKIAVTYDEDRFDRDTILALVGRYQRVLAAVAADPEQPLSRIELLDPEERSRSIDGPVRAQLAHAEGPTLVAEIERLMRETPHAPALVTESEVLTYGELDARTTRLAALLRRHGVGPERTVAVIADRGIAQLVGVLAVLRAGGAYVPINPDQPDDRTGWMLDETRPAVILVGEGVTPPPCAAVVVRLDDPDAWPAGALDPTEVPRDALAYVIYTSGSTGRPKGVMITRRALDAQLRWHQHAFRLDARCRNLQLHAFTFDVSVLEIFWPLLVGGAVVLPAPGDELDGHKLGELVERTGTTVVQFVPSMMTALLEALDSRRWRTVELLISAGEALSEDLVQQCARAFPTAVLVNGYGPTEATIIATTARCREATPVSIGLPVTGTTAYVLGRDLGLVPPDGVGELWLGGILVARAYLAQPALTADRFLPDPFTSRAGARMYRTGDLVRRRRDGNLEYLGRLDHQIKVRGFRIELGEIEAVLRRHAAVTHAVVAVDERGDQLIAYVVLGHAIETTELARFLAERLPSYMVPAAYVVLSELPRTQSGKLDRKALPAPQHDRSAYVAPEGEVEQRLATIWCGVLELERVSRDASFFALGGHSLLVLRLVSAMRAAFGVEVTPRMVFDNPTLARLAARVAELEARGAQPRDDAAERALADHVRRLTADELAVQHAAWANVALPPVEIEAPADLEGARRALFDKLVAQHHVDANPSLPLPRHGSARAPAAFDTVLQWDYARRGNFPTMSVLAAAFSLTGSLDVAALRQAVDGVVARQGALRTTFRHDHGVLVQTVNEHGPSLVVTDLSSLPEPERTAAARRQFAQISRLHDLSRETFRAELLVIAEQEHILLLSPHHIVVDGFSFAVLQRDLGALYRKAPELSPLGFEFNDFAAWQTSLEERPVGKQQLAFWARSIADFAGAELPGDKAMVPRGTVGFATDTYSWEELPFALQGERWQAVEALCARRGITPYTVVATGFLMLLSCWSGRDDVLILSSSFHRNREGSEDVIGNFVTSYPLRMTFRGSDTIEESLVRVQQAVLDVRENAHVAPTSAIPAWTEWSRYNLNYVLAPSGGSALDLGPVAVARLAWSALEDRSPFDLALFVTQAADGLTGTLVFNGDRFSREMVERARVRLVALFDTITGAASQRMPAPFIP